MKLKVLHVDFGVRWIASERTTESGLHVQVKGQGTTVGCLPVFPFP